MPKRDSARTEKVNRAPLQVPKGVVLGAHMSIAGGTWKALERARALGCTAVQLFVKNNTRWEGKSFEPGEGKKFQALGAEIGNPVCFAHNTYLTNLASPDETVYRKSIVSMVNEIRRCAELGLPGIVAHPGAAGAAAESDGIRRIVEALDGIFERTKDVGVQVWLETTAGQGTSIGWRFEHLAAILAACGYPDRLGVCLDTAHVFAAGYDIRTPETYLATMLEFANVVGFDWLRAVHVNDSKTDLGSRVDRHEHIGKGKIGREAFCMVMNDDRLRAIPKVIETPKGREGELDWENLGVLLGCVEEKEE